MGRYSFRTITAIPGSGLGEFAATSDLVLRKTLAELEDGTLGGGVAISEVQHPEGRAR